ncbi:hypothetical protein Bpfe_009901 [Biomphalaria pfeifferi]|uniref:Uncharacterized protein n=1 Tax=Biomphalaria pfeifferi TaxID=112525 RepID=A0AAD8BV26_BIOPF|nr:hypothetical protein Bpfe_009901 [Biomphalaria pfeifferi]
MLSKNISRPLGSLTCFHHQTTGGGTSHLLSVYVCGHLLEACRRYFNTPMASGVISTFWTEHSLNNIPRHALG